VALKTLAEERDSLDEKVKKLAKELKAKDTAMKEMRSRVTKEEERDTTLENEVGKLQEKLRGLERDVQRKDMMAKELKSKVAELHEEKEALSKKLGVSSAGKDQAKKLKSELERREDALKVARNKIEAISRECEALRADLRAAETREARAIKANNARASEWDALVDRLYALEDTIRGVCGAILGQVERLGAKYAATGAAKRVTDGMKMVEVALRDSLNPVQVGFFVCVCFRACESRPKRLRMIPACFCFGIRLYISIHVLVVFC
jgi:chromosome segregation ATPase